MGPSNPDMAEAVAAVERAFPDRTLPALLRRHVRARANAPAVTFNGVTWTYRDLVDRMDKVAQALANTGLGVGDRIAYLGKNNAEFAALWAGASAAGVVLIPLNWRLAMIEVVDILADSGARVLYLGPEYVQQEAQFRGALPEIEHVIHCDAVGPASFADWCESGSGLPGDLLPDNGMVALQLYTSGTTGRPKGVLLTHDSLFWQRAASACHAVAADCQSPEDVLLVSLTVSHVGGLVTFARAFFSGGHAVVLSEFSAPSVLDAIPRHGVSRLTVVPSTLQLLLRDPLIEQATFSSVRIIQYGASPIPVETLEQGLAIFGCDFVQVYGLTEAGGTIAILPPQDHQLPATVRMKSIGVPLPGVAMRVAGPDGAYLTSGEIGEIQVSAESLMQGYWKMPEETAAAFTEDGFFRTGDAGYCDADGYFYLCDRIKDMIVTGGENVYPAEVEHALFSHPGVVDSAVIGVPDERWGEAVKAIVVRSASSDTTEADLIAHVRARIAHFKAPKSIDFVTDLPRNAAGKVLRRKLAEPYWAGRERRIN